MAKAPLHGVLGYLQNLRDTLAVSETPDAHLLARFAHGHEEAPFAALVRRHGPMVWSVCRRVLPHVQDAEDVFQATFLLLARKAGSIRKAESVGSWLHGVAHRLALKARLQHARERARERRGAEMRKTTARETTLSDAQAVLDAALDALPEKYRAVLVLCYLEGKTQEEAAQQLGCPLATVRTRVVRGRKLLRDRLGNRGLILSTAGAGALLIGSGPAEAAPAALVQTVVQAGLRFAAGQSAAALCSPQAAGLVAAGLRAMFLTKAKTATVLLAVGLVAGAAALTQQITGADETAKPAVALNAKPASDVKSLVAQEKTDSVDVSGRVLDPEGRPVAGAKVTFHQQRRNGELTDFLPAPVTGTTDASGRFQFSGSVHPNVPSGNPPVLTLIAHVPGYGSAVVETDSPHALTGRTLRLVKDNVSILGHILNLEGKPVPGVTVRPVLVIANAANSLDRVVRAAETNTWAELPDDHRTNMAFSAAAAGLTQTAVTDAEGKFSLSGFGRERIVLLRLDGPAIQTCFLKAMTRAGPAVRATTAQPKGVPLPPVPRPPGPPPPATYVYAYGATFDYVPGPGMVVEGAVRDQDTGKPLAGVVVRQGIADGFGWGDEELTTTTDAKGNYRLVGVSRPSPQRYIGIEFVPPAGQQYFTARCSPPMPELGQPARLDVRLKRGVLVKGRVTDKATGQPVQAVVEYFAFADNPTLREIEGFGRCHVVSSKKDGSFTLPALPGRGIVAAKTDAMFRGAYLYGQGMDAIKGLRFNALLGGSYFETKPYMCFAWMFDTLAAIEPDANAESVACDVQLDPGKTAQGITVDPDGKPLTGVRIHGPRHTPVYIPALVSEVFTIPAVNPRKADPLFFEHPKKKLAAAVLLKGDEPAGFTVKLKPTATVTGRVLTEDGEPISNTYVYGRLQAGQLNMTLDQNSFFTGRTDAGGRFKIEGLLAGVKLGARIGMNDLFTNLVLEPGEVRNLKDIRAKNISE